MLGALGTDSDAAVLLWPLAALLAVVVATAAPGVRRRLGRAGGFVIGAVLGGAALVGLIGIALLSLGGTEAIRRAWDALPSVREPARVPLPGVHGPEGPRDVAPQSTGILTGPVTHVRDGDTIVVAGTPIRIANLDCAEAGTHDGERATTAMRRLAQGRNVRCALEGRRSYDREIGTCVLNDGRDVGVVMIEQTLCRQWRPAQR